MSLAAQLTGSFLILVAFIGVQMGKLSTARFPYLIANVVGSGLLLVTAVIEEQWGFVLLEIAWLAVSFWSLVRLVSRRTAHRTVG
jgi:hypothetical protein